MVRELTKLYTAIKNEERENTFTKMLRMDPDCEDVDKNFIIAEQIKEKAIRKIISESGMNVECTIKDNKDFFRFYGYNIQV
ncbi:hypothetical protein FWK35_00032524 [Aphis craccivora]|uniref:Uncharacterized protein n=1 Tax=Aphis craccivora TaxID=307492 RepID=A0A6G0YEI7_APHCR|nr:hypothetical protein FWK35_00032524 [Aphis craccivora]